MSEFTDLDRERLVRIEERVESLLDVRLPAIEVAIRANHELVQQQLSNHEGRLGRTEGTIRVLLIVLGSMGGIAAILGGLLKLLKL